MGFALETDNAIKNAKLKLHNKKLDMIILNSLEDKGLVSKGYKQNFYYR